MERDLQHIDHRLSRAGNSQEESGRKEAEDPTAEQRGGGHRRRRGELAVCTHSEEWVVCC